MLCFLEKFATDLTSTLKMANGKKGRAKKIMQFRAKCKVCFTMYGRPTRLLKRGREQSTDTHVVVVPRRLKETRWTDMRVMRVKCNASEEEREEQSYETWLGSKLAVADLH